MNEKRSFDAVLSHLTNRLNSRGEGSERNELEQVIRVLEAAGKIDKNKALSRIGEVYDYQIALGAVRDEVWGEIRALLESLPDKEE